MVCNVRTGIVCIHEASENKKYCLHAPFIEVNLTAISLFPEDTKVIKKVGSGNQISYAIQRVASSLDMPSKEINPSPMIVWQTLIFCRNKTRHKILRNYLELTVLNPILKISLFGAISFLQLNIRLAGTKKDFNL